MAAISPFGTGTVIVHGARTEPRTRYARIGSQFRTPVGADALIGPQNGRRPTGVSRLSLFPFSHEPVGLVHRPLHGVQNVLVAGAAAQVAGDKLAQLLRVYCLPEPTISTADMMMPGVQKPHWTAASSTKAR